LLEFERQAWERGYRLVAGVDEAGRGPLAGPVIAAAVLMERAEAESAWNGSLRGIKDSKQLSASARGAFYEILRADPAVRLGVGLADVAEIERLNILHATHLAMVRAVLALPAPPECVLVDGLPVPGFPCPSTSIVGGDARSLLVAAASVVAKVTRDRVMAALHTAYPQYGFDRHKGYGTPEHVQALLEHGPCPAHRAAFRPVRESLELRLRAAAEGARVRREGL
jgi:ribonuclease HII